MRQQIGAAQMYGDHAVPLRRSDFLHRLHRAVLPGVVYKNIHAAKLGLGNADEVSALLFLSHIGGNRCRAAARAAAPSPANFSAMARPIPRPPPVITATFPANSIHASAMIRQDSIRIEPDQIVCRAQT